LKEQQEIGKQVDEILKNYECEGQIDIWEWMKEKEQEEKGETINEEQGSRGLYKSV